MGVENIEIQKIQLRDSITVQWRMPMKIFRIDLAGNSRNNVINVLLIRKKQVEKAENTFNIREKELYTNIHENSMTEKKTVI